MGGQQAGRTNIGTSDLIRDIEKRVLSEERRPQIRTASDLMGPGIGPQAIEVRDWNEEATSFNGLFFSTPGALNSPDVTRYWMGFVLATEGGDGFMLVYEYRGDPASPPAARYHRTFTGGTGDGTRTFGVWQGGAQYRESVNMTSTVAAAAASGNRPALRLGNPSARHLRIGDNALYAMATDTTLSNLVINNLMTVGVSAAGAVLIAGRLTVTVGDLFMGGSTDTTQRRVDWTLKDPSSANVLNTRLYPFIDTSGMGMDLVQYLNGTENSRLRFHDSYIESRAGSITQAVIQVLTSALGVDSGLRQFVPYSMCGGLVAIAPTAANTPTSASILFPTGASIWQQRFSVPPILTATAATSVPGTTVTGVAATTSSATSGTIWVTRTNTTTTSVYWMAYQADQSGAAG